MSNPEEIVTRRIQVFGRVQGVFFRASTKEQADRLGIKGWVKNEPDSSVLILATGTLKQLEELEAWCRKGPIMANVTRLESAGAGPRAFEEFSIRTT